MGLTISDVSSADFPSLAVSSFHMKFRQWPMAPQRLLSLWSFFRDWVRTTLFKYIYFSLPSLTNRPTSDVGSGNQADVKVEPSEEPENTNADTVITRDAQGQFVYGGLTGIVELLDNGAVIKSPFPGPEVEEHIRDIAMEASIYRQLGSHERLVGLVSHSRDGLVLEYMEMGDLKVYLQTHNSSSIPMSLKLKWAYQAAEAVKLLHDHDIIHCDIKPRNFLLDTSLNIKIIDFSGSSINGSKPRSGEGTRFYLPRHWRDSPTKATDLFALGSTLYEIFQGSGPYEEIPSDEVESLFKLKKFPNCSAIPCGQIIKQCWLSQVESVHRVQTHIGNVIRDTLSGDSSPRLDGLDIGLDMSIAPVESF